MKHDKDEDSPAQMAFDLLLIVGRGCLITAIVIGVLYVIF